MLLIIEKLLPRLAEGLPMPRLAPQRVARWVGDMVRGLQEESPSRRTASNDESAAREYEQAREVLAEQGTLVRIMKTAGDPKRMYLQLCLQTTHEVLALQDAGRLRRPAWILRLLGQLHGRFSHNLRRWLSPQLGPVEPHWQSAFTALDLVGEATTVYSVLTGLRMALQAQLEHDLPQVIAELLLAEPEAERASLQADLQLLAAALGSALEYELAAAVRPSLPGWLAASGKQLIGETVAFLLQRHVYDLSAQYLRAFARGVELADATAAGTVAPQDDAPLPLAGHVGLAVLNGSAAAADAPAALPQPGSAQAPRLQPVGTAFISRQKAAYGTGQGSAADAA